MKLRLLNGFMIAGALTCSLAACHSNSEKVAEERKDLQETQAKAAQDVQNAQAEAIKDVNDTKESAAKDIQGAEKDLRNAEAKAADEGTTSGFTHPSNDVRVTPEQCARFATTKSVLPEDRALYEACSKMNKDALAK
jgi:hypothetical protein